MNKPHITLISSMVCTRSLTDAIIDAKNEFGDIFDFRVFFINDLNQRKVTQTQFFEILFDTTILLIDIRGNNPAVEDLVRFYNDLESNSPDLYKTKTIISLVGGNAELRALTKMGSFLAKKIPSKQTAELGFDEIPDLSELVKKGIRMSQSMAKMGKLLPIGMMRHIRNWTMAMDYWVYGYAGIAENHKNLIRFLLKEYLNVKMKDVPPPLKIPSKGIFHPGLNEYYCTLDAYIKAHPLEPQKQTVGIFYYGGIYFEQTLPILKEFIENLAEFNVIPVYAEVMDNLAAIQEFFFENGKSLVSLVVNLQYFQLNGGPFGGSNHPTMELYTLMDVPQFNPIINFDMSIDDYTVSKQGMLPINQIIAVIMPELDGRIEMMNVGCMGHLGNSEEIGSGVFDIIPLKDNIQFIANRIRAWLRLRVKSNAQKRIGLILYDYPPGEATIGNASYLDVMASVHRILLQLQKEGYNVADFPDKDQLSDFFMQKGLVNNPEHIDTKKFAGFRINFAQYQKIIKDLPQNCLDRIDAVWGSFPGKIMSKNSEILLPIVQFGNIFIGIQPPRSSITDNANEYHNQELPPHHQYLAFYRFLESNLNLDALIHVGTHGTEEFLPGKENVGYWTDFNILLQGSLPNLYLYHVTNTSEAAIAKRRGNAVIINHAPPPLQISETYENYARLESLLEEYNSISHENMPDSSLHQKNLSLISDQIKTAAAELSIPYDSIPNLEHKLYRLKLAVIPAGLHILGQSFTDTQKIDFLIDLILHSPSIPSGLHPIFQKFLSHSPPHTTQLMQYLDECIQKRAEIGPLSLVYQISPSEHQAVVEWIQNLDEQITSEYELPNLIHGLEGGFIKPGFGGDPIRTPEVFPTGRNSYGFDPRLIPSSMATKRGAEIAQRVLEKYVQQNGRYPETVSVVLWAFETMKTGGETIGQIFEYLGVRAVKHKSVWTTELELVPLEEMTHPRINVVITICGIFRDTFPYLLDLINQAIELVAALDEPFEKNFIKNSQQKLSTQGMKLPLARIFGPAPGKYNTNLTDIINKGEWKDENELVTDYIENMGHAYLSHQSIQRADIELREHLKQISVISQIRDGAEYQITDLDHYYEFSGGLMRATQAITGKAAPLLIADTASNEIMVEPVENSIREGIITRNLNPRWLDGMLKHKYHGTQKVSERVENLLGLSATTHRVDNWVWEKSYERYIADNTYKSKLIENNRFAMMNIVKSFLEANKRGYWSTDEENIRDLRRLYLELEGWVEKNYSNE
jgi:cobaltochelatase CobN